MQVREEVLLKVGSYSVIFKKALSSWFEIALSDDPLYERRIAVDAKLYQPLKAVAKKGLPFFILALEIMLNSVSFVTLTKKDIDAAKAAYRKANKIPTSYNQLKNEIECPELPPEIWNQILYHLPPSALGNGLLVSRLWHATLIQPAHLTNILRTTFFSVLGGNPETQLARFVSLLYSSSDIKDINLRNEACAAIRGDFPSLEKLFQQYADINKGFIDGFLLDSLLSSPRKHKFSILYYLKMFRHQDLLDYFFNEQCLKILDGKYSNYNTISLLLEAMIKYNQIDHVALLLHKFKEEDIDKKYISLTIKWNNPEILLALLETIETKCVINSRIRIKQLLTETAEYFNKMLELACSYGHIEIVKIINHYAIKLNFKLKNPYLSFDLAAQSGFIAVMDELIKSGLILDKDSLIKASSTASRYITSDLNLEETIIFLFEKLRSLDASNTNDLKRFLFLAIRKANPNLVEYFIRAGANCNEKDSHGNTPLYLANEIKDKDKKERITHALMSQKQAFIKKEQKAINETYRHEQAFLAMLKDDTADDKNENLYENIKLLCNAFIKQNKKWFSSMAKAEINYCINILQLTQNEKNEDAILKMASDAKSKNPQFNGLMLVIKYLCQKTINNNLIQNNVTEENNDFVFISGP